MFVYCITRSTRSSGIAEWPCPIRYVTWNRVDCCRIVRKIHFKGLQSGAWPWKSLKIIENDAIWLAVHHLLYEWYVVTTLLACTGSEILRVLQCTWLSFSFD